MRANLPDKKQVLEALLEHASSVFIHLDPRRRKVVIPPQFRKQSMLVLEIGLNMRVPIPDLEIDDEGIGCTLSFGSRPYWCRMPWSAVFALVTNEQRGMVWPPDVPDEVADRFIPPAARQAKSEKPKAAGPRLVSKEESSSQTEPEKEPGLAPVHPLKPKKTASSPDYGGNAAAVLEPPDDPPDELTDDPSDDSADNSDNKPKRKLPSYLRVVK